MNKLEISIISEFDQTKWLDFIERVLMYKSLPIVNMKSTANEFLIYANNELIRYREFDTLKLFQTSLLVYYFNLNSDPVNNENIYNLHFVFSAIKPKIELMERLELQLTSENLKNQYYQSVSLHSSLLALLIDLEIINKDRIQHHLNQCNYSNYDLSFARVSLRFFIKNGFIKEYFRHFFRISEIHEEKRISEMLGKSILELRDYLGSFFEIYFWVIKEWPKHEQKATFFKDILKFINKYMHYENNQFRFDPYAKLIKCYIIKDFYLIPPKLIVDILEELFEFNLQMDLLSILKIYIQENILKFDPTRSILFVDYFDGLHFFHIYPTENKEETYADFKLPMSELLVQKININYYNLLDSFIDLDYDELAQKERTVTVVKNEDKPIFQQLVE